MSQRKRKNELFLVTTDLQILARIIVYYNNFQIYIPNRFFNRDQRLLQEVADIVVDDYDGELFQG